MTASKLIEIVALADLALLAGGLAAPLIRIRRYTRPMWWLLLYLVAVLGIEVLAKLYVFEVIAGTNLYLLHIYTPLEFALLSAMYLTILDQRLSGRLYF